MSDSPTPVAKYEVELIGLSQAFQVARLVMHEVPVCGREHLGVADFPT